MTKEKKVEAVEEKAVKKPKNEEPREYIVKGKKVFGYMYEDKNEVRDTFGLVHSL